MRKAFIISGVFISGLIGAGFATGSEIYFYFSRYGAKGYLGIVLSALLFAFLQYVVITQSGKLSAYTFDEYLYNIMPRGAAVVTIVFSYVLMLFILSAMLSGFGEMLYLLFGIKKSVGALIMLSITAFVISKGHDFFIKSESVFFVMIIAIMLGVFAWLYSFRDGGAEAFLPIDSWQLSAVSYTGYNMLTGSAVLCILSKATKKTEAITSAALTFAILTVIMCFAGGIIILYQNKMIYSSMPIVEICRHHSAMLSYIYAAAVFLSMLTTAISTAYPLRQFLSGRLRTNGSSCFMYAAAYLISGMEFSFIVDKLYRISGIISAVLMVFIILKKISKK